MHKTNLEERTIVKMGSILQSRNATKKDVLIAYVEAEHDCGEENDEILETYNNENTCKRYDVQNYLQQTTE